MSRAALFALRVNRKASIKFRDISKSFPPIVRPATSEVKRKVENPLSRITTPKHNIINDYGVRYYSAKLFIITIEKEFLDSRMKLLISPQLKNCTSKTYTENEHKIRNIIHLQTCHDKIIVLHTEVDIRFFHATVHTLFLRLRKFVNAAKG